MSQDWPDRIAQQLLSRRLMQGICLLLGAADTGKTTLAAALAKQLAQSRLIGLIDADIGQSHIGLPTTVGWAVLENQQTDFSQLAPRGISFVGDITPVGHLLQLTAAIVQGVQQVSKITELIIIDTPGFIRGPAAAALWWTVQRILKPESILAVQRSDELNHILVGLQSLGSQLEVIESPPQIPLKSPQDRRIYRRRCFVEHFRGSHLYNISLSDVAVQTGSKLSRESLVGRLVGLRDEKGTDMAVGIIGDWQDDKGIAVVRAAQLDIQKTRCLVIGDASIDIAEQ